MSTRSAVPLLLAALLGAAGPSAAPSPGAPAATPPAERRSGPVVDAFGAVYAVPDPEFATPHGALQAVFDVAEPSERPDAVNPRIETVARFLNMHAQAGVPHERMRLTLVLHGGAGKDALSHDGYRARFGVDNPNRALLAALREAGVEILLCGQTAAHRALARSELVPEVGVALSAMTVLVARQAEGDALIAF